MVKNRNEVKAVVFDIGGVLQLPRYPRKNKKGVEVAGIHDYMSKRFNMDIDTWFDALDSSYGYSITGKISREKAVSEIARHVGVSKERIVKEFHKTYKKFFRKNKELYEFAYGLRKKGYLIGILSDQWYLSEEVLMPKKDTKNFNVVIVSTKAGIRKPDIRIYRLLVKKLKEKDKRIKASDIVFVDNRDWNMGNAKKIGIKTILFENNRQCFKSLRKLGVEG